MNKLGKGPNLTWIFIGLAFAITVLTLSMTTYDTFLTDNNVTMTDEFSEIQGDLNIQEGNIGDLGEDFQDEGIAKSIYQAGTGIFNVFITGLGAIDNFFTMSETTSNLLITSGKAIPGLTTLIALLTMIAGFYIVMGIIKARRGTGEIA